MKKRAFFKELFFSQTHTFFILSLFIASLAALIFQIFSSEGIRLNLYSRMERSILERLIGLKTEVQSYSPTDRIHIFDIPPDKALQAFLTEWEIWAPQHADSHIVLTWRDPQEFLKFKEELAHIAEAPNVWVSLQQRGLKVGLPQELSWNIDADDCVYPVMSICSYVPAWTWIIQRLFNLFPRPEGAISRELPHFRPNLILQFPPPGTIPVHSWAPDQRLAAAKFIFIGQGLQDELNAPGQAPFANQSSINQDLDSKSHLLLNRYVEQSTYIPSSWNTFRKIPLHHFWASLSYQFEYQYFVKVISTNQLYALTFLVVFVAMVIPIALPAVSSTLVFLLGVILLFVFQGLIFLFGDYYIPLAMILIFAWISFLLILFFKYFWGQTVRQYGFSLLEHQASLRAYQAYFLKIIGHNLNSPIAKILMLSPHLPEKADELESTAHHLQFYVHTILALFKIQMLLSEPKKNPPVPAAISPSELEQFLLNNRAHALDKWKITLDLTEAESKATAWESFLDIPTLAQILLGLAIVNHAKRITLENAQTKEFLIEIPKKNLPLSLDKDAATAFQDLLAAVSACYQQKGVEFKVRSHPKGKVVQF